MESKKQKKIGCNAYKGTKLIWFESAYSGAVFLSDSIFDWTLDFQRYEIFGCVESTFRTAFSLWSLFGVHTELPHPNPTTNGNEIMKKNEVKQKTGAEIIQISNEFLA